MLIVIIGWVLFRSSDLNYAFQYLKIMFGLSSVSNVGFTVFWYLTPKIIFVLVLAIFASIDWKQKLVIVSQMLEGRVSYILAKNLVLLVLLFLSIMAVITSTYNPFIYFRF